MLNPLNLKTVWLFSLPPPDRDFVSQLNISSVRLLHYEYVCGDQWAVNHIFCFIFLLHLSRPNWILIGWETVTWCGSVLPLVGRSTVKMSPVWLGENLTLRAKNPIYQKILRRLENIWDVLVLRIKLILYCDKLWLKSIFYSYILYSSLYQKLLVFTLIYSTFLFIRSLWSWNLQSCSDLSREGWDRHYYLNVSWCALPRNFCAQTSD